MNRASIVASLGLVTALGLMFSESPPPRQPVAAQTNMTGPAIISNHPPVTVAGIRMTMGQYAFIRGVQVGDAPHVNVNRSPHANVTTGYGVRELVNGYGEVIIPVRLDSHPTPPNVPHPRITQWAEVRGCTLERPMCAGKVLMSLQPLGDLPVVNVTDPCEFLGAKCGRRRAVRR